MRDVVESVDLVACCGLYCGACRAYLKGKCPGCPGNEKATWCRVRTCCLEKKIATCAACEEFADPRGCRKFDNFMSKLFGFIFRSDRPACIAEIKRNGPEAYAKTMAEQKLQSIRR